MRILIIHNQLWAHYKSKLFSEIYLSLKEKHPGSHFLVAHIASHEASRSAMKDENDFQYDYPYRVLFNRSLEEVGFKERFFALLKTFREYNPTILNITGYFDWTQVLLMIYAKSKGVKVVLSSESSSVDNSRSVIKENIKRRIVGFADIFFCFGKSSADYLLTLGVKPNQIPVKNAAVVDEEIIRANYDRAKSQLPDESDFAKHNFIFVGRLAPEKNLVMLIQAFSKIKKQSPEALSWGLIFAGEGPSRQELEKLAFEKSDSIKFVGGWPWHKVPQWLAKSDVLVLPSLSEPWGLVVNEAMVCGMPVIVSENCGCVPDLLENEINGFVFNPQKQEELEEKLLFFINNPGKIISMGGESERLIHRFSSKNVASEMVQAYCVL